MKVLQSGDEHDDRLKLFTFDMNFGLQGTIVWARVMLKYMLVLEIH